MFKRMLQCKQLSKKQSNACFFCESYVLPMHVSYESDVLYAFLCFLCGGFLYMLV